MATLYYRPYTSDPITDGEMATDAGRGESLPDYEYIFPAPPSVRRPQQQQPQLSNSLIPKLQATGADYITQIDGQLGEIEKYKDAMRKMGQDILALRDTVRQLEQQNSRLRTDLGNFADTAKILHDSVELDGIPKSELLARYATLKRKLGSTQAQAEQVKQQVHRLQQQLIGAGESQQQLQRISSAHTAQQKLLQQLQERAAKVKRLEETCSKQEAAIEQMEHRLREQRENRGQKEEEAAKRLLEENRLLRDRLGRLREEESRDQTGMEASERLELYQLLDAADARVAALENQLESEARSHRKEKSQLLQDIEEAERNAQPASRRHGRKHRKDNSHRRHHHHHHHPQQPQLFAVPVPVDLFQPRYTMLPSSYNWQRSHARSPYDSDSQSDDTEEDEVGTSSRRRGVR